MNTLSTFAHNLILESEDIKHLTDEYDVSSDEWTEFIDFLMVEVKDLFIIRDESNERGSYKELLKTDETRIARWYPNDSTIKATFNWDTLEKISNGDVTLAKKILK